MPREEQNPQVTWNCRNLAEETIYQMDAVDRHGYVKSDLYLVDFE
ncbi:hypothetical protein [Macrococcus brunensis]|nr:hypothetical protein [Macrococcus brunensis]